MATKLRDLRFDQAANLVDDPANPHARVVLFKRAAIAKQQPAVGQVHVDRPEGEGALVSKPYPNEHAARLNDPGKYSIFTRQNDKFGAGIDAIFGIYTKDGKRTSELQAVRFDSGKFTSAEAKAWLSAHDYPTGSFEPAKPVEKHASKEHHVKNAKQTFMKKLLALFKDADAGPLADWASREECEPEQKEGEAESMDAFRGFAQKFGDALAGSVDGAGLVGQFKALHKELCDKLVEADARKEAAVKAAEGEAEGEAEAEAEGEAEGRVRKMQVAVNKQIVELQKKVDASEKRAVEAEKIAKSERDARDLDAEKVTLRKFRHVAVDVEKEAESFRKLRITDKSLYDSVMAKLNATEAVAEKNDVIARELGSPLGGGNSGTAWAEIEAEAEKLVAKDAKMTKEKAVSKILETRHDLAKRYYAEDAQNEPVAH